jgi:two-component system, response regulator YesN
MLNVLLVEDNPIFRETIKLNLLEHFQSMVVEEASTGEEALEKVKESPPHLILMDIRLPGINGLQSTQKIKRDFPNIQIAILTGYDLPEYRQAALQYGADCFLVKESIKGDEIAEFVKSVARSLPIQ